MSDNEPASDLNETLKALSRAPGEKGAQGRRIFPVDNLVAYEAIVREVSETVLTRWLTLVRNDGLEITVLVHERRVCSGALPGTAGNAPVEATAMDRRQTEKLKTALRDFAATAETIEVVSVRPDFPPGEITGGVPAEALMAPELSAEDFHQKVLEASSASVSFDGGEQISSEGSKEALRALAEYRNWYFALQEPEDDSGIVLWGGGLRDDFCVILCHSGQEETWAIAEASDGNRLADLFAMQV
ncbi:hypothetical protein [Roseobacter sp. S98]|uniref:hypothetical protein n=1 Tax=Roseobacter algicola (ex Choi et al. 2025) (nom. illeg.) TaxID=3092138 RepID=UPI0035C727F0